MRLKFIWSCFLQHEIRSCGSPVPMLNLSIILAIVNNLFSPILLPTSKVLKWGIYSFASTWACLHLDMQDSYDIFFVFRTKLWILNLKYQLRNSFKSDTVNSILRWGSYHFDHLHKKHLGVQYFSLTNYNSASFICLWFAHRTTLIRDQCYNYMH